MDTKKNNFIKSLLNIIFVMITYGIFFYYFFKLGFREWLDLDFKDFSSKFFSNFTILLIIYFISNYISLFFHELGHLYFGLKANLKFGSLSVFSFLFTKKNNKLIIKRNKNKADFSGMCYMIFEDDKPYSKKEITLYFMGGIIFNFILCMFWLLILILSNNFYLNIICMFFTIINLSLVLYNSIPMELKYGSITDMLQIKNIFNDPQYIRTLSRCTQIQNLNSNGIAYKDMDKKLFIKPKKFEYFSDVLMAIFYVEYMSSKGKHNEVIRYIKLILNDAKNILSKNHTFYLKLQLVVNALYDEKNYTIINEYWNDEFEDYLLLMGRIYPQFVYIVYVYRLKLNKDTRKANDALKLFYLMEKKYSDKKIVEEINKKIDELRKEE